MRLIKQEVDYPRASQHGLQSPQAGPRKSKVGLKQSEKKSDNPKVGPKKKRLKTIDYPLSLTKREPQKHWNYLCVKDFNSIWGFVINSIIYIAFVVATPVVVNTC